MAIERIRGGGELFKFPITLYSKFQQFPFRFYWKHGRALRYLVYSTAITSVLFYKLQTLSNVPANVKQWEEIRAKRRHTFFDLPHDDKH